MGIKKTQIMLKTWTIWVKQYKIVSWSKISYVMEMNYGIIKVVLLFSSNFFTLFFAKMKKSGRKLYTRTWLSKIVHSTSSLDLFPQSSTTLGL